MANKASTTRPPRELPDVSWNDTVRFVRQLSHDLRNHLNAVELQSVYIGEIASDPELKDEIKRLRGMLSGLGAVLQKLSADMAHSQPSLMPYKAADFLEDLRRKIETDASENTPALVWDVQVGDATVELDPQLLPLALLELLVNAGRHGIGKPVTVRAIMAPAQGFVITLIEPKENFEQSTNHWGREPLRNINQGRYGLGLNRARTIIEAHGGQLEAQYDQTSKTLVTKITLPGSPGKN